jgi:hypothetical protein
MNHTQRWLARVRPRHNPAENALIANMRDDPHIPWLNSLAAMRHYARQRWPHDPGVQSLITGVWQRYQRWHDRNLESALGRRLAPIQQLDTNRVTNLSVAPYAIDLSLTAPTC